MFLTYMNLHGRSFLNCTSDVKATMTAKVVIYLLPILVKKPTKHCKFITSLCF